MGFFSWNCQGCGKSIRSRYTNAGHKNWMSRAVALTKNGSVVKGEYNGYGRIGDFELMDAEPFSLWHDACWLAANKPGFTKQADSANDQGCFCGEVLTLFPPGHDPEEVKERHTEEIQRVLAEIQPELASLGLNDGLSFLLIMNTLKERHAERMKALRAELGV